MVRSCPFVSGNEENAAERFALFDMVSRLVYVLDICCIQIKPCIPPLASASSLALN